MRKICFTLSILLLAVSISSAQNLLNGPEGVVYDSLNERYLVANATDGYIVQINKYREQSYFASGFSTPLGLKIIDSLLFITTNHPPVVYGLDLNTAEIKVTIPITNAYSLAGLDTDTSGYLYVIDQTGKLYQIDLETYTPTLFVGSGLPNSLQGLVFDETHNRFVLCSYPSGSPLLGLNLDPLSLVTLAATIGGCIPIIKDDEHNYYYGSWVQDRVFKFDSAFTSPPEIFSSGHNNPTGLCYNKFLEEIAIANYGSSTIDFVNMFVNFEADTLWGWAPLNVTFTPTTDERVDGWTWDFGDGGSSTDEAPSHNYETPGFYDVSVTSNIGGDEHINVKYGYICILADSLKGENIEGDLDSTLEIIIDAANNMPLQEITIPVEYDGSVDLEYVGYSLEGCRLETFEDISYIDYDMGNKRFMLDMLAGNECLYPGTGPLIKLQFEIIGGESEDSTIISMDGYSEYETVFGGTLGDYLPDVTSGYIKYIHIGCCYGTTGNVDCSEIEIPDIADITRLIDFLYLSHEPLCCLEEADADASGGDPDIADITRLIDYLYISHDALSDCP